MLTLRKSPRDDGFGGQAAGTPSATTDLGSPRRELAPARLFLLIAPFLYFAYALLTPPFQTFDENQHLYRAWQISGGQLIAERRGAQSGGELPPGLATATIREIGSTVPQRPRAVAVRPFRSIFAWNTPAGADRPPVFYNFFGAAVYSPVGYGPQVVAVKVGQSAGLSVEWTIRLGRLFNSALCIVLIWLALIELPVGRWIMMTIGLLPPAAACAASFGQDGIIIGSGFLLTAIGLNVVMNGAWSSRSAATGALTSIALALSKFVYFPLAALAMVPRPARVPLARWWAPPLSLTLLGVASFMTWLHINSPAIAPFLSTMPSMTDHLAWMAAHPIDFGVLVVRTYVKLFPLLWADFYIFGDSTIPVVWGGAFAGTAAILVSLAIGDERAALLGRLQRTWMILICLAVAVMVAIALFLSFTMPDARLIEGIQARYFVPVLPLAMMALMRSGETERRLIPAVLSLCTIANAVTLGVICSTFYTA